MKLPSINYLFSIAKESLLRFPLTLICAFVAVCVGIYLTENESKITNMFPFINLLLSSALGIPLFFGLSIFTTSKQYSPFLKILSNSLGVFLLIAVYFSLPDASHTHNTSVPYIRYGIFNLIIHLLVSFSPYLMGRKLNGFWNFNKILFIRFWTSVLFSGFLYVGLVMALLALKVLFEIEIHEKLFFEFYIVIIGLFNTWFFVSGIPSDLEELENIHDYPKGLKIFAQYILLPLLILYLIILYAYGSKILISWDWPKGVVSYLISCVSVLGILNVLLFYPYSLLKENLWINKFSRAFYLLLFPLIIILFIAVALRIQDYGITINRYVIVMLGIWLTIIATYFSFNKANIKFIPMSLAIILGVMSFGPWGMFAISEHSQVDRLMAILTSNNFIQDGKIVNEVIWKTDSLPDKFYSDSTNTNENILADSISNELKSILDYLDDHHGFSGIRELFVQNIDSLIVISLDSNKSRNEASVYMQSMGFEYKHRYKDNDHLQYMYSSIDNRVISLNTFEYLVNFDLGSYVRNDSESFLIDGLSYRIQSNVKDNHSLYFISDADTLDFEMDEMILALNNEYGLEHENNISQSKMTLEKESSRFKVKVIISSISIEVVNDSTKITSLEGNLFLKKRKL